jgi:glycosyltransferase involved in cell wall biosynthesis
MKTIEIANISTFLPRECGIATFSNNLLNSIVSSNNDDLKIGTYVVSLDKDNEGYKYSDIVKHTIRQNHMSDYINAAQFINFSQANLCILQHEYGIFGGESGTYILSLIHNLRIPVIVIFHTVLEEPSYTQKIIVQKLSREASKVVVMSDLAINFLQTIYGVPKNKIAKIGHGVPDFKFMNNSLSNKRFDFKGKKVLLTFGLINRNKGIETVLEALGEVIKKHPEIIYIILGKTHPNVLKESGEEYRNFLHQLVQKYSLSQNIYFYNYFVSDKELFDYLSATDIYIIPYLNKAQMTSGPLSYALGAGCAVLSTPFWHAEELLREGRGKLFEFGDYQSLSKILIGLLDKPNEMLALRKKAYDYGRKLIWPEAGKQYVELILNILKSDKKIKVKEEHIINPMVMPTFSLKHIQRLTYNTGIIQHATYNIPNLKTGYSIDDNARALLMTLMAWDQLKDEKALDLLPKYLSFINYMQNEDGTFRNLLSFDHQYLDEKGTEDSFGRTIWALGYLIHKPPDPGFFQLSLEMFSKAIPNFKKIKEVRSLSYTINGLYHYLKRNPSDEKILNILKDLTAKIISRIDDAKDKDWIWFENKITYANGIIPLALFYSYKILKNKRILKTAKEVLTFLEKIKFRNNYLDIIGNNGWYEKGGEPAQFAQQPLNATAIVLAYYQAYSATKNTYYLNKMYIAYLWFLGENELSIPLYNFDTKGCADGLENFGVNKNQGAESTISYLIAHLKVLQALNKNITH